MFIKTQKNDSQNLNKQKNLNLSKAIQNNSDKFEEEKAIPLEKAKEKKYSSQKLHESQLEKILEQKKEKNFVEETINCVHPLEYVKMINGLVQDLWQVNKQLNISEKKK